MKKGQWGGSPASVAPDSGPSAGNYLLSVVGDGWTQFTNALMSNPAQNIVAASQRLMLFLLLILMPMFLTTIRV